jgi:hypothetical protein
VNLHCKLKGCVAAVCVCVCGLQAGAIMVHVMGWGGMLVVNNQFLLYSCGWYNFTATIINDAILSQPR